MIYNDLKSAIEKVKVDFINRNEVENITDWQGNIDYKGEEMLVTRNIAFEANVTNDVRLLQIETACDLPWAEDHFQERISGIPSNPGETYRYWPYHNNLDDSKYKSENFSHTYQERFWPKKANNKNPIDGGESTNWGIHFQYGDLEDVISLLLKNPLTRQAYLPIWFPEDTWAANNSQRVPCTLGYYFWIRGNKLYCNYIIRSCDLLRHFRNDVYLTCRLIQYVSEKLNIKPGNLTMFIFNLHIFKKDLYPFSKKENSINNYGKNK